MKLDQETFSFEAQFANLGPIEGIYFCVALREKYRWNKRQTQSSVNTVRIYAQGRHLDLEQQSPEKPAGPCERQRG